MTLADYIALLQLLPQDAQIVRENYEEACYQTIEADPKIEFAHVDTIGTLEFCMNGRCRACELGRRRVPVFDIGNGE